MENNFLETKMISFTERLKFIGELDTKLIYDIEDCQNVIINNNILLQDVVQLYIYREFRLARLIHSDGAKIDINLEGKYLVIDEQELNLIISIKEMHRNLLEGEQLPIYNFNIESVKEGCVLGKIDLITCEEDLEPMLLHAIYYESIDEAHREIADLMNKFKASNLHKFLYNSLKNKHKYYIVNNNMIYTVEGIFDGYITVNDKLLNKNNYNTFRLPYKNIVNDNMIFIDADKYLMYEGDLILDGEKVNNPDKKVFSHVFKKSILNQFITIGDLIKSTSKTELSNDLIKDLFTNFVSLKNACLSKKNKPILDKGINYLYAFGYVDIDTKYILNVFNNIKTIYENYNK